MGSLRVGYSVSARLERNRCKSYRVRTAFPKICLCLAMDCYWKPDVKVLQEGVIDEVLSYMYLSRNIEVIWINFLCRKLYSWVRRVAVREVTKSGGRGRMRRAFLDVNG
jgi:hypothetical protein